MALNIEITASFKPEIPVCVQCAYRDTRVLLACDVFSCYSHLLFFRMKLFLLLSFAAQHFGNNVRGRSCFDSSHRAEIPTLAQHQGLGETSTHNFQAFFLNKKLYAGRVCSM